MNLPKFTAFIATTFILAEEQDITDFGELQDFIIDEYTEALEDDWDTYQ